MTTVRLLGVRVTAMSYAEAVGAMLAAARERRRIRAHFSTVHSLMEATRDPALAAVFESAEIVATDGMPLVWLARRRGVTDAERVCGPDVMLSVCDRGREDTLRHFFLGGRPGTPEALASRLGERFPGLVVAGVLSPPFRVLSRVEDAELVDTINAAAPDVVWIGLGSPKQEFWAADHMDRLRASLVLPVGAAFDFHSGQLRRAPRWMQRFGLEWLFRLAAEPRRLFRRYVTTNARFAFAVLNDELARRRRRA
jgi:N-acetylglucosaminyldiphosphoundecaprenol N-acetyl-beta-D-mannosaminyltransferase